jgi:hypothetical protein
MSKTIDITQAILEIEHPLVKAAEHKMRNYLLRGDYLKDGKAQPINPCAHITKITNKAMELQKEAIAFYYGEGNKETYVNGLHELIYLCVMGLTTEVQKEINQQNIVPQHPTT